MTRSVDAPRRLFLRLCVLLATCAGTPGASAQGAAASESGFVIHQNLVGTGGFSESAFMNTVTASVSQIGTGREWSSANYIVRDGVVWSGSTVGSTSPIVTGVRASGLKEGGETVRVFGFNFQAAGAGLPDVEFAGGFGTSAAAGANTYIDVESPAGVDLVGNPLGASSVAVTTNFGTFEQPASFFYEPALVQGTHAQPGKALELQLHTLPNSFPLFAYGNSFAGFGINVVPFDGQLVIPLSFQLLTGALASTPSGFAVQSISIPDDVGLVGANLEFQVLSLDDLTLQGGAWSNLLSVPIVP